MYLISGLEWYRGMLVYVLLTKYTSTILHVQRLFSVRCFILTLLCCIIDSCHKSMAIHQESGSAVWCSKVTYYNTKSYFLNIARCSSCQTLLTQLSDDYQQRTGWVLIIVLNTHRDLRRRNLPRDHSRARKSYRPCSNECKVLRY